MKNGYTKDIAKLIKAFLKINIWVFGYTAPNEDNNIQKNTRNPRPNIKKRIYLITKFFLTFSEIDCANDNEDCSLTLEIFLSDKNINFIIAVT